MSGPLVGIVMGSDSDLEIMNGAAEILTKFGVLFEMTVASAHRSPARSSQYARSAIDRGLKVIIAGAGWAAALPGALAAETTLPVIGIPIDSSPLNGLDALMSIVQMPPGIPVATVALGKGGAQNAGILAVQILALSDETLRKKLQDHKAELVKGVEEKSARVENQ